MSDNYDSGFDLVLSDQEKDQLIHYYKTEAYPDWIANWLDHNVDPNTGRYTDDSVYAGEEYEEMHWDGIQFEENGRMFDLCMHFIDGKAWCEVYECDWVGQGESVSSINHVYWTTNTQHRWLRHEEIDDA